MLSIEKELDVGFYNDQGVYTIPAKQYDTGRKFCFNVLDGNEPYDLEDVNVYLRVLKADGKQFQSEECCSVENNVVTVDCSKSEQLLTSPGINKAELHFYNSDIGLTTWNFNILVEARVHDGSNIVSEDTWDKLDELLNDVHMADNLVDNVEKIEKRIQKEEVEWTKAEEKRQSDFDDIKTETTTLIQDLDTYDIDQVEETDSYKIKIVNKNGTKYSPNLLNKISMGAVETVEYTENASATITGDFGEQVLNLKLPKGKPGEGGGGVGSCAADIPYNSVEDTDKIKDIVDNKVDKENGKGLSTNDYTADEKNKLAGISENANNYTLPIAGTDIGGVKNGGNIVISEGGIMSVDLSSYALQSDLNNLISIVGDANALLETV